MDVSIIVPVWNQAKLTNRFFRQNARYANQKNIEYIVVDNGSTDNTDTVLRKWQKVFSAIRVISLPENIGFGAGNNVGAEVASGDTLIFTQNDVSIHGDYIGQTIHAMSARGNNNAIFGTTLITDADSWNTFGRTVIRYLQGWYLAMGRDVWDKIRGFDERYFPCDYEDMDISYTAERIGIELCEINLPLTHMFGGTTRQLDRLTITKSNQLKFKEKWGL